MMRQMLAAQERFLLEQAKMDEYFRDGKFIDKWRDFNPREPAKQSTEEVDLPETGGSSDGNGPHESASPSGGEAGA